MARMGSKVLVLGAIDTIEGATVEEGIWSEGFLMVRMTDKIMETLD